jgi:molybdenum cofactor cytidylyltransferase
MKGKEKAVAPAKFDGNPDSAEDAPRIAAVVLAAGASVRMGEPKQFLKYGGQSLLRRVASEAIKSICRPVVVVLGAHAERLRDELKQLPVEIIINEQWAEEGLSSSVRCGIRALLAPDKCEAAVLMLCDQPLVTAQAINRIAAAYFSTGKPIVASQYNETLGVPALFARPLFAELENLSAGGGAKEIIARHRASRVALPLPEGAFDVDTPEDYARLKRVDSEIQI